jgi:hypothetical protein
MKTINWSNDADDDDDDGSGGSGGGGCSQLAWKNRRTDLPTSLYGLQLRL